MPQAAPIPVCVITAAYPAPSEPTRAIFIENLCREVAALAGPSGAPRFKLSVVAPRIAAADPALEERFGLRVRRFGYPSGGRRLKEHGGVPLLVLAAYLISGFAATLREVRRMGAAVLYSHWVLPAGVIGAAVARVASRPLVAHAHGSDIDRYAAGSRAARRLARWVLRRSRAILAVSSSLESSIADGLGVERSKLSRLPMGIDGRVFHAADGGGSGRAVARRSLGLDGHRTELLFVGDLIPEKGIIDLARALAGRQSSGTGGCGSIRLNIAGDGSDRAALDGLARRDPERIRLLGKLEPERLADWYRAADLLVLPSRGEGAPVSVMEALSCGLPVVATAVGGVPELVRPASEGFLVRPGAGGEEFLGAVEAALCPPERLEAMRKSLLAQGGDREDRSAARRARELAPILEEAAHGRCGRAE